MKIQNLSIKIENKLVLQDISFEFEMGQIYFVMGQNGSGKSSLFQAIIGNPKYQKTGKVNGQLDPSSLEIANQNILMTFQNPVAIDGVTLGTFLKKIMETKGYKKSQILQLIKEKMQILQMPISFLKRGLNLGLSGGERKKSEILQALLLEPKVLILDEIDSGVDQDNLAILCRAIELLKFQNPDLILIFITHNSQLLNYFSPTKTLVLGENKLLEIGEKDLAIKIFEKGYKN